MDFRQLSAFTSVVQYGTFSRAAEALYLTQPTVSAHIRSLENELQVTLFERRNREVVLTEAGKEFYPYACNILLLREKGSEIVQQFHNGYKGEIRISASSTPGQFLVPHILKQFLNNKSSEELSFKASIQDSASVISNILSYQSDLGFVGEKPTEPQICSIPIYQDVMVAVFSSHLTDLPASLPLCQVLSYPFILRSDGSATREILLATIRSQGHNNKHLHVVLETNSLPMLINCVSQGLGVSILPRLCLPEGGILQTVELADVSLQRDFYLIYRKDRVLSPAMESLLSFLTKEWSKYAPSLLR